MNERVGVPKLESTVVINKQGYPRLQGAAVHMAMSDGGRLGRHDRCPEMHGSRAPGLSDKQRQIYGTVGSLRQFICREFAQ